MLTVFCRFYEELNDFLQREKRKTRFSHTLLHRDSVKDVIESLGIPHTEVDLILVNGNSVDFHYRVHNGDDLSIYPVFESIDISPVTRLAARPLRRPLFVLDVHLGKLARFLRMMGLDAVYRKDFTPREIISLMKKEKRIILTRSRGLLKHKTVTHGCLVRSENPETQAAEVLRRFDLLNQIHLFTRCMECNHPLKTVAKDNILDSLPPKTRKYFDEFQTCPDCKRIYWKGSHYENMVRSVERIQKKARDMRNKLD